MTVPLDTPPSRGPELSSAPRTCSPEGLVTAIYQRAAPVRMGDSPSDEPIAACSTAARKPGESVPSLPAELNQRIASPCRSLRPLRVFFLTKRQPHDASPPTRGVLVGDPLSYLRCMLKKDVCQGINNWQPGQYFDVEELPLGIYLEEYVLVVMRDLEIDRSKDEPECLHHPK